MNVSIVNMATLRVNVRKADKRKTPFTLMPTESPANVKFREAVLRVGASLKRNAEWFLSFGQRTREDLELMPHAQRVQLWHDLLVLSVLATRPTGNGAAVPLSADEEQAWTFAANWPEYPWTGQYPSPTSTEYHSWWSGMLNIHRAIDAALTEEIANRRPILYLEHVAFRGNDVVFPVAAWRSTKEGTEWVDAEGAVLVQLLRVLQRFAGRFRQCRAWRPDSRARCRGVFVAHHRSDQTFCSTRCRVRDKGFRARKDAKSAPTKKGKRHGTKR